MKKEFKLAGHYARRYWWRYVIGILSLLMVDAVNTLIPRLTGEVTDGLTQHTLQMDGVWQLALRIVLMGALIAIGRFGWRVCLFGSARHIERDIRYDMFAHMERLSQRYYNEHKTGDLMAHFTNDLQAVRQLMGMTIITTFDASVMLVLVLYNMIVHVSLRLTVVAVIPLLIIIVGDIFFGKAMHKRFLAKQEAFSNLTDQAQESVSGIRVIKAFVQEHRELAAFARANRNSKEKNLAVVRLMALVFPMLDLIIGVSSLLTLLYGGWLAICGDITLGQFVAFNSYINMLVWPMIAAGECVSSLSQGMASLKRIRMILDEVPDIADGKDTSVTELRGGIELRHLTFDYPGTHVHALEDISVKVAPGETLAIIGRTGAGKTTLVSLIERLYDTERADMVLLDGRPVRDIPLHVIHRDIAYVPQDNFLFSDTIENNISFGLDEGTESHEAVVDAAKAACVHENIMDFPDQYETLLGERGVTVSGGQKQRISIARALMKRAPILVLDDSLSAVDTDTEEQILGNLKKRRAGATTLMIAHRISTIQHADHILVLEEGKAVEYGTHAELMALGGVYRSIYDKQQLEKQLHEDRG